MGEDHIVIPFRPPPGAVLRKMPEAAPAAAFGVALVGLVTASAVVAGVLFWAAAVDFWMGRHDHR